MPSQLSLFKRLAIVIVVILLVGCEPATPTSIPISSEEEIAKQIQEITSDEYATKQLRAVDLSLNGVAEAEKGNYEKALEYFQEALLIYQELDLRTNEQAQTLYNIGTVYGRQGNYEEALKHFEKALVLYQELDNHPLEADTLHKIGVTYVHLENYEEASGRFQKALDIAREVGDHSLEETILKHIEELANIVSTLPVTPSSPPTVERIEGNFVMMKPIEDYGYLTIGYRIAQAPIQSGAIKGFFTFPEYDELLSELYPHQYEFYINYRPVVDTETGQAKVPPSFQVITLGTVGLGSKELFSAGFSSLWDPEKRVLSDQRPLDADGNFTNIVSPGVVPVSPPSTIYYVTGRGSTITMPPIALTLRRSGNVMPKMWASQTEFYDCWEYEADSVVKGGEIKPKIWVEKTTGIVVGGMGDFPSQQTVMREIWVLINLYADGQLRTLELQ